jgi:hypothetical protein
MTVTVPRSQAPAKAPPSLFVTLFSFVVVIVYLASLAYALTAASAEVWGALLLVPVLVGISLPLCKAAGRAENDARVTRLMMVALVLKLVGACVNYAVAFQVYSGEADGKAYDKAGRLLAANFRAGNFNFGTGKISDTHFIEVLTGFVYTVIGSTRLGGYFVFSWFGFLGLYFFYRAFVIAVPHGDHRRYALLVFFLPSLLFWSSSIGKEAWMILTLGAVAYGAARAFARKPFGFVFIGLGAWGAEACRAHMALLILGGLLPAYLIRRAPKLSETKRRQSLKILGVAALVALIVVSVGGVEQRFKVTTATASSASSVLDSATATTAGGKSQFTPTRVHSPVQFPMAFLTVMFRPFLTEAHNSQGIVAALEGAFLMFLSLRSLRRLMTVSREMVTTPYVMFALVYTLIFVWAFSTISNFGILVRERVQVYPMFFVLLALPNPIRKRKDTRTTRRAYAR